MAKRIRLIGFVAACAIFAGGSILAEVPRKDPAPGDTLQAVLDRIRNHAANDAWKQPGWKDDAIETWLDKLVGSVAKAADFPDLKLPVRMAEVKAGEPVPARLPIGALFVGKDLDLSKLSLRNSIVLANGNVEVSGADGCVIVARGTVTIHSISQRSVIVAGTMAKLQLDGRPANADAGSLVVSRGWVDLGNSAYGTLVAAHEGIHANRFKDAVFINAAVPAARLDPRAGNASRSLTVNDLPLERLTAHPLSSKLSLLGVLHGQREKPTRFIPGQVQTVFGPTGIVFRFDGRKYVAEVGQTIVDESGNPVEGLRHWKLSQIAGKAAIFSGAESDAVVRIGSE